MPKISELNAITSVANTDLLMVVHDPGGSPSTNKITVNNFITSVSTQLRGYTGSGGGYTGSAGTTGYTGSSATGYTGSAGGIGYTGSSATGYTGSAGGTGYAGSAGGTGYAGSAGNLPSGQSHGYVLSSNSTNGTEWTPNPDVVKIAYVDQFGQNEYYANSYDSVVLVDPTAVNSNVTVYLPQAAAIEGHRVTVKNINTGGPGPASPYGYTVTVTTTNPGSNYIEHPVTGNFVTSYELKSRADGETWIHDGDIYRHVASEATAPIFYTDANTYAQVVIKNTSASENASGDVVVYNDTGDENAGTGPFIDMGINSSNYSNTYYGNVWGPSDAYLYNTGGDLIIGPQTNHAIKFVAGNTNTADIKLTINSTSIISNTNLTVTGILKIENGVHEAFGSLADATGIVTHDCANGHIFYHSSPDANFTANVVNINLSNNYATTITLVIAQGATGYYANALHIEGAAQTINWQGNLTPSVSSNRTDIVSFNILNNSGSYIVLGQLTGF
jgi:hypothetical protein